MDAARFLAENKDEAAALELVANVWRLWLIGGDVDGGRQLLAAALDLGRASASSARAHALYGDGLLAFRAGQLVESRKRNEEALATARTVGDREAEALALVGLSRIALREGRYDRVRSLAARARDLTRDLDPAAGVAALHLLAAGVRLVGEYDEAIDLYSESLEVNRALGDRRMVGVELHNIGHVELHRGNAAAAERCFAERADFSASSDPYEAAMTHLNRAALAFARGDRRGAADFLARSQSTLDDAGIVLDPDDAFEVEWLRNRLT